MSYGQAEGLPGHRSERDPEAPPGGGAARDPPPFRLAPGKTPAGFRGWRRAQVTRHIPAVRDSDEAAAEDRRAPAERVPPPSPYYPRAGTTLPTLR